MPGSVEQNGVLDLLGVNVPDGGTFRPAIERQPFNVVQDRYDGTMYRELMAASEKLRQVAREATGGDKPLEAFPDLMRDLWATYYKPDPELTAQQAVDPTRQVNRPFVERVMQDSETAKARTTTVLDEVGAGFATLAAAEAFLNEYRQRQDLQDAVQQAQQAAKQMQEQMDQEQGDGDGQQQGAGGGADLEALQQQMQQAMDQAARSVRMAAKAAAEKGNEEAERVQTALGSWGLESGDLKTVPMAQRLDLVRRLASPNLRKLADLIGRYKNLARARQRLKLKKNPDQVVGVESGADLPRLLATEYMQMNHPVLRQNFKRGVADGSLLQYKLDSKEKVGRGPMVKAVDISGSMDGDPLNMAIAIALGLLDTAARQKRATAVSSFDTELKDTIEWLPGERDAEKLVRLATWGTAGGTDYWPAMEWAVKTLESSRYNRGDFVMTTDGRYDLPADKLAQFQAAKKAKQCRALVLLISNKVTAPVRMSQMLLDDPTGQKARAVFGQIVEWADEAWALPESLAAGNTADDFAGDIFEEVF
jgi:uncharacterized protein with von Willebrand factor type A (vWA) domain